MMGWLGSTALAAHQVAGVITTLGFMVYYGIAAAVTIRVSNFRGRNDWPAIRHASFAGLHLVMGTATIVVLLIGIFRNIMGYIITPEKEVVELVALLAWSVICISRTTGCKSSSPTLCEASRMSNTWLIWLSSATSDWHFPSVTCAGSLLVGEPSASGAASRSA